MLSLRLPGFSAGTAIPLKHTCDGLDMSPALYWDDLPHGTKSLVLTMEDLDSTNGTWTHWIVYHIPPTIDGLPEDFNPEAYALGIQEGLNDWHELGYRGPCPSFGQHRYVWRLFALNLDNLGLRQPTRSQLMAALNSHVLGQADYTGIYAKGGQYRQAA